MKLKIWELFLPANEIDQLRKLDFQNKTADFASLKEKQTEPGDWKYEYDGGKTNKSLKLYFFILKCAAGFLYLQLVRK